MFDYVLKCILLTGNFLVDYTNRSNLHIAITDSQGEVVEFDESGVRKDRTEDWNQCLVVNLQETEPMVADMVQVIFIYFNDIFTKLVVTRTLTGVSTGTCA